MCHPKLTVKKGTCVCVCFKAKKKKNNKKPTPKLQQNKRALTEQKLYFYYKRKAVLFSQNGLVASFFLYKVVAGRRGGL